MVHPLLSVQSFQLLAASLMYVLIIKIETLRMWATKWSSLQKIKTGIKTL